MGRSEADAVNRPEPHIGKTWSPLSRARRAGDGTLIAARLLRWQSRHGRHDLPWLGTRDPYRVWLAEIMLQQTQVASALPYYLRFLARLPTLADLAAAPAEDVMALWAGLGYYARARNLHACARHIVAVHGGQFPRTPAALAALPGIGRSTANAIAATCFGAHAPVLDGNVKRVFCRHFLEDALPGAALERRLWALADAHMPAREGARYNQALMDLGAGVCTRAAPRCDDCPLRTSCGAFAAGRVDELPVRKARRPVPLREATLLAVIDAQNRVLLEARPPRGIWGGLLSLPELPAGETAEAWLRARVGARRIAVSPRLCFDHVFTHFRLRITPLECRLRGTAAAVPAGWTWHDAASLARAGVPAPVRRILGDAFSTESPP